LIIQKGRAVTTKQLTRLWEECGSRANIHVETRGEEKDERVHKNRNHGQPKSGKKRRGSLQKLITSLGSP